MAVKNQGRKKRKASAIAYLAERRSVKNKAKKITRHLKHNPNDEQTKTKQGVAVNYKSTKVQYDILGRVITERKKSVPRNGRR